MWCASNGNFICREKNVSGIQQYKLEAQQLSRYTCHEDNKEKGEKDQLNKCGAD